MKPGFWTCPEMFVGGRVAVLASGPGMTAKVADRLRTAGVPAIAINNTFRLAPWAAILYAADPEWWRHESTADARAFPGLKVSVSRVDGVPGIKQMESTGAEGYDSNRWALRTGGSSAFQALHLALHTGAKQILLCGFNMTNKHGSHWHGDHPRGLRNTPEEHYLKFRTRLQTLVEPARRLGVDVVNVTPDTALECFRLGNLEDELCRAL